MSVYREKDRGDNSDRRPIISSSVAKKTKKDLTKDMKSATPYDAPAKKKPSTTILARESGRQEKFTSSLKTFKRKSDGEEKDGKSTDRSGKHVRNAYADKSYLRDALEKKAFTNEKRNKIIEEKKIQDNPIKSKGDDGVKSKRDRTRTRTLSPTEIKQLIPSKMASGDHVTKSEQVLEVPKTSEYGGNDGLHQNDEEEYENDFENYESDFEEDESQSSSLSKHESFHSTEESSEKDEDETTTIFAKAVNHETIKCDSASTLDNEVPLWKQSLQKRRLEEIKKSIEKENKEVSERRKSISNVMDSSGEPEQSDRAIGGGFIDFSLASKKQKKQKEANIVRKRGKELLNMITLDTITYNILEIPPKPYESYMRIFGKSNTKQVHVQTNEDNLEEETQTDDIQMSDKWTQHPPDYLGCKRNGNEIRYVLTNQERLGVGGDSEEEEKNEEGEIGREILIQSNSNNLLNFLSRSSQMILAALERKSGNFLNLDKMPLHSKEMAFGDGYALLNTRDVSFLSGRSVTQMCLLNENSKKLLTVHVEIRKYFQKCFLCVWSFQELSKPLKILVASNRVISCCFGPNQGNLILAGLYDGTICLWDLRESLIHHSQASDDSKWILQSPTYTTAGNVLEKDFDQMTSIVSIQLLNAAEGSEEFDDFTPIQVFSLDKNGNVTIWFVIQLNVSLKNEPSNDLGLAHWGRLKLVRSSFFNIFETIKDEIPNLYITCYDAIINVEEDDGFYISNSFGSVSHVSAYGSAMKPKFFVPAKQDSIIEATCLEMCPFDGNYFLVGVGDGSIRLHFRHKEKPLITLNSGAIEGERQTSITAICWLNTRPCVFFALDSKSRIHIWDLGVSDMYPDLSLVLTEKKILSMKLLTDSRAKQTPFMVIGMEDGSVEIHKIRKEYGWRSAAEINAEKRMFLKYVSIL